MTAAPIHSGTNTSNVSVHARELHAPLQTLVGFFFAYRLCLVYLGFQSDPRLGAIVYIACSGLLFTAALVHTLGDDRFSARDLFASRTLRWLFAYLAVTGLSLLWTAATSIADATVQWASMAMEAGTVLLLIKKPNVEGNVDALMRGFVIGMLFVDAVAWLSPVTVDLRIGNEDFLHPNVVGLYSALAFFLAQQLSLKQRAWRWCCLALGITLLRSISKTSIIAFVIAESFYLLREKQIQRSLKIKMAAVAALAVALFGTLLRANLEAYVAGGDVNQVESLTGRTALWASAFSIAIEHPVIGSGFYSFRSLVPSLGTYQSWHAHNEWLQQFFEYGLLGVFVSVGLYLSFFLAARSYIQSPYRRLIFTILLFAMVHGLTETVNFGLTVPFWLLASLAVALQQTKEVAS